MSGKQLRGRGAAQLQPGPRPQQGSSRPLPAGNSGDFGGVSGWERTRSSFQRWDHRWDHGRPQVRPSDLPGDRRETKGWGLGRCRAGKGATYRSEASSLLMYSSRMLVSMLEGSRAPLMSWPAGQERWAREGAQLPADPGHRDQPSIPAQAGHPKQMPPLLSTQVSMWGPALTSTAWHPSRKC